MRPDGVHLVGGCEQPCSRSIKRGLTSVHELRVVHTLIQVDQKTEFNLHDHVLHDAFDYFVHHHILNLQHSSLRLHLEVQKLLTLFIHFRIQELQVPTQIINLLKLFV